MRSVPWGFEIRTNQEVLSSKDPRKVAGRPGDELLLYLCNNGRSMAHGIDHKAAADGGGGGGGGEGGGWASDVKNLQVEGWMDGRMGG